MEAKRARAALGVATAPLDTDDAGADYDYSHGVSAAIDAASSAEAAAPFIESRRKAEERRLATLRATTIESVFESEQELVDRNSMLHASLKPLGNARIVFERARAGASASAAGSATANASSSASSSAASSTAAGSSGAAAAGAGGAAPAARAPGVRRTLTNAQRVDEAKAKDPNSVVPIIIIPDAPTSLISLYNVRSLLEDGVFMEPGIARESWGSEPKPPFVTISRPLRSDPKKRATFHVYDDPSKFSEKQWARVVSVFAQGAAWQFRDYPFKSPAELFAAVCGFHVHYQHIPLGPPVSGWLVQKLPIHRDLRHYDQGVVLDFWRALYNFLDSHVNPERPLFF